MEQINFKHQMCGTIAKYGDDMIDFALVHHVKQYNNK